MAGRNDREGEHPCCDEIQNVMIVLSLAVWALDSFFYNWSTFLALMVPFPVRLLLGACLMVIGGYLGGKAHNAIFGEKRKPSVLVDSGVFGLCRHPMYLGIVLFLFGFSVSTFSLASMFILAVFFLIYDRFASYEERQLLRIFGGEYVEYQRRVSKWFPIRRRRRC